jgi:hypothetical protein
VYFMRTHASIRTHTHTHACNVTLRVHTQAYAHTHACSVPYAYARKHTHTHTLVVYLMRTQPMSLREVKRGSRDTATKLWLVMREQCAISRPAHAHTHTHTHAGRQNYISFLLQGLASIAGQVAMTRPA